mgnify:CR=1 FL=1
MKFKKIIITLLTLCLIPTSLVGCKPKENPITPEKSPVQQDPPVHTHIFLELPKEELLVKKDYFEGTTYYKSCSCGEVSTETFTTSEKPHYTLLGESSEISLNDYVEKCTPETLDDYMKELALVMVSTLSEQILGEGTITLKRYNFEYESLDIDNKPIILSGSFTYPCLDGEIKISSVDFDSHPTFTDKKESVIKGPDIYSILSIVGSLVLEFDLIGFGLTEEMPACYHCRHLSNRNTVDGIIAAYYILKELGIDITTYPQYFTGYSQGGFDSMALLRYYEEESTDNEKTIINPIACFSGSGAYDLKVMFDESLQNEEFQYPEYLLMGIITAKYYHPEIFGEHTIEEFLTDYGKRFVEPIISKDDAAIQALKQEIDSNGQSIYKQIGDFFNIEFINNHESPLREIVDRYCKQEGLLGGEWKPTSNLHIYYSDEDEIVTSKCSHKAEEIFASLENVHFTELFDDHRTAAIYYYLCVITEGLLDTYEVIHPIDE